MPQVTLRAAAAFISFFVGLAAVWFMGLLAPAEEGVAEWLVPTSNISVPAGQPVGREEEDAQKVYETVLRELYGGDDSRRLLVVRSVTADYKFCEGGFEGIPEVSAEALDDYNIKRDFPTRIPQLVGLKAWVAYIRWDEYVSLYCDPNNGVNRWDAFYRRFPGSSGYMELSPIGYNRAGDEAFVYAWTRCGPKCGGARLVVLRKGRRGWGLESTRTVGSS